MMIDIRDGLKVVIDRSGLKQMAVAKKANMTKQQLSDIVNKRRRMDANELVTICQAINVTPNDVIAASSDYEEVEAAGAGQEAGG